MDGLQLQHAQLTNLLRHLSPSSFDAVLSDISQEILDEHYSISEKLTKANVLVELLLYARVHIAASHSSSQEEGLSALRTFSLSTLHNGSRNEATDSIRKVVDLCAKYEDLLRALVEDCVVTLRTQVRSLTVRSDNSRLQNGGSANAFSSSSNAGLKETEYSMHITVDVSLVFLKMAAWCGLINTTFDVHDMTQILTDLVGHTSLSISTQSQDALCAILTSYSKENSLAMLAKSATTPSYLLRWARIVELTNESSANHCKGAAYTIWLHALLASHPSISTFDEQRDTQSWRILHCGLAHGTSEQQKACLAIAKTSMAEAKYDITTEYNQFESEQSEAYNTCFAKFCTLYETVSSRYLNQVQECLPDLTMLANSATKIHKAWLVALLTCALGPGNQESIRGLLGGWAMKHIPGMLTQCVHVSQPFLEHSFLPWATTGHYFTTSVANTRSNVPTCLHGEAVVTCIRDLIRASNAENGRKFAKAALSFLDNQGGKIFSSARAYTLEGIRQGLKDRLIELDNEDVEKVVRIGFTGGFQDVMNDFMILQCAAIASHTAYGAAGPRYDKLHNAAQSLREQPSQASQTAFESTGSRLDDSTSFFENIVSRFASPSDQNLKDRGLFTTSYHLLHSLDSFPTKSINSEQLAKVINAIWEEIEVQDYPKHVVTTLPSLVLHPTCIEHCEPDSPLSQSLCVIIRKMQKLVANRVYAFAPFATALHKCVLQAPQVSRLPLVDIFVSLANEPPCTKVEFRLAGAIAAMFSQEIPHRNYEFYLGKPAGYGYACMFDTLNRWPDGLVKIARQIIKNVLDQWVAQSPPVPVFSKWKTSIQLQMVLILTQRVVSHMSSVEIDSYLRDLYYILSLEPLPRYRYLLEWTILRIYVHSPERRDSVLNVLSNPDLSNPKHVVSMMKIATSIALLQDTGEEFTQELMLQLNIFAASPKIVLRHEAQWSFPLLWQSANVRGWNSVLSNPCLSRFNDFVLGLPTYQDPPKSRLLEKFDPVHDHTMTHLVAGAYLGIEPSEEARVCRKDFLDAWEDLRAPTSDAMIMPLGSELAPDSYVQSETIGFKYSGEASLRRANSTSIPLQIKANPFNPEALTMDAQSRRSSSVIVIASLIDSTYNLGGITRACEILGASALYMRKASSVLKDRAFSTLSVSSEFWLPIRDLEPVDIPSFLVEHKRQGFEAAGIEQTDSSKTLGDTKTIFKEKTVLVLGGEREGIPALILGECDWCVEIKQIGITRSLNVQTAAACVLYEYTRQRRGHTS